MVDDAMAKERPVLHQPKHGVSPFLLMKPDRVAADCAIAPARLHPQPRSPLGRTRTPTLPAGRGRANWRICSKPLTAQPKRPRAKRAMSWRVAPVVARSARISPTTGANLKP